MRRGLLLGVVLALLGLAAGAFAYAIAWRQKEPILVGLLHSQTGSMASIESPMIEAELLAIDEINAAGGLLGRPLRAVVADGASDGPTFARQAQRLIHADKVSVLIGCWSSEARKAVRPVVEEARHLLIYPASYEGLEESPHIVYLGGAFNQQVVPAVSWCCEMKKARKFFLIGNNSLWARALTAQIRDQLHALQAGVVGEVILDAATEGAKSRTDWNEAIGQIERAKPDVIISTVEAPDNPSFYGALRRAGITPERAPVISFVLDEEEIGRLPIADVVGQYAPWSYVQSIDRVENLEFLRKFRTKYAPDRVIDDNVQLAYQGVRVWAETVEEVETDDVATVNRDIVRQSLNAPEGIISIDPETRHAWRPFYLGRVRPDGQFEIVWSLTKSIRPVPYPTSRTEGEWDAFVDNLMSRPIGRGSAPPAAGGPG